MNSKLLLHKVTTPMDDSLLLDFVQFCIVFAANIVPDLDSGDIENTRNLHLSNSKQKHTKARTEIDRMFCSGGGWEVQNGLSCQGI